MAFYTIKDFAELFDISPQSIYKLKGKNKVLAKAMAEEAQRQKDNKVVYGKRTFDALFAVYGDRVKQVDKVVEPVEKVETQANEGQTGAVDEVDKQVDKVVEPSQPTENAVVELLKEENAFLKEQLAAERKAREDDKASYIKLLEEAQNANHEMRVLLLKDKEKIALLEEGKKTFFQRLKDKLVKKND